MGKTVSRDPVAVSVIVPCFNNASLLPDCVRSLRKGILADQIIIIDDCSTDGSLAVAQQLAATHEDVVVFERPHNGGAAAARRTALNHARNTWIAFVDADDLVEEDAVANAFAVACQNGSDICIWDMWRYDHGKIWRSIDLRPEQFPKSGRQAMLETLGGWRIHPLGVAQKELYVSAYKGFDETMINADELITRIVFAKARSVSYCSKRYFYRANPRSASRLMNMRRLSSLDSYLWLLRFIKDYPEVKPEIVARGAIAEAWYFLRHREDFDSQDVLPTISLFLQRLAAASDLHSWIWRNPKSLIAFGIMRQIASRSRGDLEID